MAEIKNRELSQFSSFLHIDDVAQEIGITTEATPFVGIGTTNPTEKLHVVGNILCDNDITADFFYGSGAYLTGISTFGTSNFDNFSVTGVATISTGIVNNFSALSGVVTNFTSGISSITQLRVLSGIVTNLSGTGVTYTNLTCTNGSITNLTGTAGTITTLSGTNLTYISETVTNLTGTAATITNLNSTSGTVTNLSGTGVTYTNLTCTNGSITNLTGTAGTITNLNSTNGTVTNLTGTAATITNLNSTSGTVTNLTGTAATITTFVGSTGRFSSSITALSGIITSLSGTNISYSGVSTFSGVKISSGIITASSSGIVTYFGDGSQLTNVALSVALQSDSTAVGTGLTTLNFTNTNGGVSLASNIATINIGRAASGSSGHIQYKSSTGIFSGSSNFTFDVATNSVSIGGTCSAANFNSTSDINLKENIETVSDALKIVLDLRGVKFDWKKNQAPSIGVIAQEVEQVLPELVTQSNPKTVNYDGIIGVLIEAIKELKSEVDSLKNSINNQ